MMITCTVLKIQQHTSSSHLITGLLTPSRSRRSGWHWAETKSIQFQSSWWYWASPQRKLKVCTPKSTQYMTIALAPRWSTADFRGKHCSKRPRARRPGPACPANQQRGSVCTYPATPRPDECSDQAVLLKGHKHKIFGRCSYMAMVPMVHTGSQVLGSTTTIGSGLRSQVVSIELKQAIRVLDRASSTFSLRIPRKDKYSPYT